MAKRKPDTRIAPCDIVIVGGGLVGAGLALALAGDGRQVTLVESFAYQSGSQPNFDDRTLALSLASRRILRALGVWDDIEPSATAINEVKVTVSRRFGGIRMRASDLGVDALGHVALARVVGQAMLQRITGHDAISIIAPARLTGLARRADQVICDLAIGEEVRRLSALIVIGADGANSTVRAEIGLPADARDYEQVAIIANATTERPHCGIALEHLTPDGPVAVLPHGPDRVGTVWCMSHDRAEELLASDDAAYATALESAIGRRLGRLTRIGKRSSYPLALSYAPQTVAGRVALVGNAAHTIHPVGAQGFNLGLRDVSALRDHLLGVDLESDGACAALLEYQATREADQGATVGFTDNLIRGLAAQQSLPVIGPALTSLAMIGVDAIPGLRNKMARRSMGFRGTASSWIGAAP